MATQFTHDCPHCHTIGSGFYIVFQWPTRDYIHQTNLLALCGVCNKGMTVLSRFDGGTHHPNLVQQQVDFPGRNFRILSTWPAGKLDIPDNIPDNVESFYQQALENLHTSRWDAAGAMFRKSLDVATKALSPQYRSKALFERINKLADEGLLTPAMRDWSHEIRLDGNEAVHDDAPETEADARASHHFTEAFLTYAFSLPALVASNRQKRQQEAA